MKAAIAVSIRVIFISALWFCMLNPADAYGSTGTELHSQAGPKTPRRSGSGGGEQDTLSLDECIAISMKNNPRIAYRGCKVEEARAGRDRAAGQRWPDLRGSGSYSLYSKTERMVSPREPGYPTVYADEVVSWNIYARIPIFTGGRISNEVGAFDMLEDSARNLMEFTRMELVYEVTSIYYYILKQRRIIESLDFSHSTLGEHLEKIRALKAMEKASKADMLRVEVRLADIIQRVELEKSVLAVLKRSLLNLMGLDRNDIAIQPVGDLSLVEPEAEIEEALQSAYVNRADYLAARKEMEAQARRVKAARAAYWPSISLFASYSGKKALGSYIAIPGAADLEDIGRVGCVLEFPIFEGGKRGSELDMEKAKLAGLKNKLREMELQIRLEVESAGYHIASTRKRLAAIGKAVEQALESLRIEKEKYDLGKGTITDVLDAESALLEMRTNRYVAIADYNLQIARLRFATGEGNESDR